ncbi:MAG: hypothetical protein BWY04_00412 [candidate division CPR1 bacterium ADurb.Bin160]|jgi:hypothetical protein|uniref:Uncharacterized protein n=1 Tax=candidate division CPR1 bacterium ADurb.Bin160 TaxID=1852826 RepID=A0A1V5ZPY1_9BACT|nr:MAG: hypothetical protein BWY04_00412 [candidate division CPR1 bacterium ADurb.Bin160]
MEGLILYLCVVEIVQESIKKDLRNFISVISKKMKITNEMTLYIPVGTKKFPLIIKNTGKVDPEDGELVEVYCKEANLNQEYLKSDIVLLLQDI